MNEILKEKLKIIPKKSGCYLWKNKFNNVIYVGKAKNLFNRTHQYFDSTTNRKTMLLVNEIYDLDYIIVNNPNEALILENNLIRKYWPKYNILLKDSAKYPYIVLTNSQEPQLVYTHKYNKVNGKYYGPLADSKFNAYELYKFLNEISPFNRNGPLKNQISVFLQLYMQNENISSINEINRIDLANKWRKCVDDLFSSQNDQLQKFIIDLENKAVERLDFEHAEKYKNLLTCLNNLHESQIVEIIQKKHCDYFCYYQENDYIVFNIFTYLNGSLISKYNGIHKIYDEYNEFDELLVNIIIQYYSNNLLPEKVIIMLNNEKLDELGNYFKIKFNVPNSKEKEIIQMGITNAKSYLLNNRLIEQRNYDSTIGACNQLAKILNLPNIEVIEAFDNSNINLKHSISGMVSFKDGLPQKKEYRKYNLHTIENKSDFQYMQEVVYRRYKHLLDSKLKLPDLIIVDGGRIQIHAAMNSLKELNIENDVCVVGLKKNDKHQTHSLVLTNGNEIELDRKSGLFNLLCNIQNEVHNYAISFYRNKHIKSMINSFLDEIKGLGEKSKNKILQNYPNIYSIKNLTENELLQILSPKKAKLVVEAINKEKII